MHNVSRAGDGWLMTGVLAFAACGGGASTEPASNDAPDAGLDAAVNDMDRCLLADGTWNAAIEDCTLPHPDPTPYQQDLESEFMLRFPANVTGDDLNPWLNLYVDPQPNVIYTCASWQVKLGYTEQTADPRNPRYLRSKDCRFELLTTRCTAPDQRTITFRVDGWGELGGLHYKISDWDKIHSLSAMDVAGCP